MAGADHGFLDLVRGVFRNGDAEHRRRQHRDAARLSELEGRDAVLVDERLFDRGFRRLKVAEHGGQPLMDRQQAARQRQRVRRFHRAAAHKCQPVTVDIDHPPAGAAQARIDAKDADGRANRLSGHGIVITSERRERNTNRASSTAQTRPSVPPKAGEINPPSAVVPAFAGTTESTRPACSSARRKSQNWRRRSARRHAR